jgi:hypothetical protein
MLIGDRQVRFRSGTFLYFCSCFAGCVRSAPCSAT